MPTRIFAITAARETVTLDSQGRAEVSFTASNTGPKSIAGRARLVPIGSTKESWLSLEGEHERKFAKGEAQQFTVKIAAPPGTPAGKCSFRLNIISVENPDDEFTEGPSVSFEVKELASAAPPVGRFPWWIVAIAAVLVVGAGIITWLLIPKKVVVPKVVGMPYQEAIERIDAKKLGYIVSDQRVSTGKVTVDAIANQSPAADQRVPPGTKVTLTLEGVKVPNLRGKLVLEAFNELKKADLKPEAKETWALEPAMPFPVVSQSPEAGAIVAPGTTVTVSAQ
jgi:PASTA domain